MPSRAASGVTHMSCRGSRLPELPRRLSPGLPRGSPTWAATEVAYLSYNGGCHGSPTMVTQPGCHGDALPSRAASGVTHLSCHGGRSPELPRSLPPGRPQRSRQGRPWRSPTRTATEVIHLGCHVGCPHGPPCKLPTRAAIVVATRAAVEAPHPGCRGGRPTQAATRAAVKAAHPGCHGGRHPNCC